MASASTTRRIGSVLDVKVVVLVAALAVVLAACGTRVSREDIVARAEAGDRGVAVSGAAGERGARGGGGGPSALVPDERIGEVGVSQGGAAADAVRDPAGTGTDRAEASGGDGARSDRTGGTAGTSGDGTSGTPIRIGSVSTLGGVAGAAQKPGVDGAKVWVRWINDRGGINEHPVEYIVVDDGGDPAKHRSAVEDLVENKGVVAFVAQWASQTHAAARDYLEEVQVPVVGGEAALDLWYQSPIYFPQAGADHRDDSPWLQWKIQSRFAEGETKLATLACVEAQICQDWQAQAAEYAPQHGFEIVYQGQGSLGQPDFTSECLQMRNAGAELVLPVFDANTINRVAASCTRQSYRPRYAMDSYSVNVEDAVENEAFQGGAFGSKVFPFVGADTPAAREYLDAFAAYAPDLPDERLHAEGWVAGKLFEKAAQGIGPDEQPTSEAVLEGLWSMEGETLDGLTAGLTFRRGEPAEAQGCLFPMVIRDGQWVAPDGMRPTCR